MKPTMFKNQLNGEKFICENTRDIHLIDGVEYYKVRRIEQQRTFLMRKDVFVKQEETIKNKVAY